MLPYKITVQSNFFLPVPRIGTRRDGITLSKVELGWFRLG